MWTIPRPLLNRILDHARRSLPAECVGLLSGQGKTASAWHPLPNQSQDGRRFYADESALIQVLRQLRETGEDLVAIYHSHPDSEAVPSLTDRQQAHYPNTLYLIVSLLTSGRLEMNGYLIQDGEAILQELLISD
ncbi:Mov34/MPN/PAD-1 family protein [Candidatus Magnetaquicoccus inordinatus]|uniref:Mov34/MPN/PAD-1 family protein n=1 Tax=Candidatus Magnetaquicoccus inordinatus TaxID=2496818 RepID=UPI00187D45C2|nr:M67 family metallopeptidase [Candidatus Magnetaquicoccus inordinatus]